MTRRKTVGLALGGGAARGIAHIGVLTVLTREKIPIDFLAGTSSGSLIAACYAAGVPLDHMVQVALQTNWKTVAHFSPRKTSLISGKKLTSFLNKLLHHKRFSDLSIPLTVVTADLYSGTEYLINEGEVEVAVRASCSVPGIFPPVSLNGKLLVDGGVVNNVPVDVVRRMGADIVLGVDVNGYVGAEVTSRDLNNLFAILYRSHIMLVQHNVRRILREADIVLRPPTTKFRLLDLGRAKEILALGEEAALAIIPQLRAMLSP